MIRNKFVFNFCQNWYFSFAKKRYFFNNSILLFSYKLFFIRWI